MKHKIGRHRRPPPLNTSSDIHKTDTKTGATDSSKQIQSRTPVLPSPSISFPKITQQHKRRRASKKKNLPTKIAKTCKPSSAASSRSSSPSPSYSPPVSSPDSSTTMNHDTSSPSALAMTNDRCPYTIVIEFLNHAITILVVRSTWKVSRIAEKARRQQASYVLDWPHGRRRRYGDSVTTCLRPPSSSSSSTFLSCPPSPMNASTFTAPWCSSKRSGSLGGAACLLSEWRKPPVAVQISHRGIRLDDHNKTLGEVGIGPFSHVKAHMLFSCDSGLGQMATAAAATCPPQGGDHLSSKQPQQENPWSCSPIRAPMCRHSTGGMRRKRGLLDDSRNPPDTKYWTEWTNAKPSTRTIALPSNGVAEKLEVTAANAQRYGLTGGVRELEDLLGDLDLAGEGV